MSHHGNISIFVPHIGCPHRCSFCDQHAITGQPSLPTEQEITGAVTAAKTGRRYDPKTTELAFFGGSFTAIARQDMERLLQIGSNFVKRGEVCGIRISTRPDAITEEILNLLAQYGVTAIELGCQSLSDAVLTKNLRGHTAADVAAAAEQIHAAGFSLGLQMMTGLPDDDDAKALETAKAMIRMRPDTVRIYPTLVLEHTVLHRLYQAGTYQPQTLEQAVSLTARLTFSRCLSVLSCVHPVPKQDVQSSRAVLPLTAKRSRISRWCSTLQTSLTVSSSSAVRRTSSVSL